MARPVKPAVFPGATKGNDILDARGETVDWTIDGKAGDDTIYGGSGRDSIFGNSGNDRIYASPFDKVLDGGTGYDTADFSLYEGGDGALGVNARLFGGDLGLWPEDGGQVSVTGFITNFEAIVGSRYNDALSGNNFDNTLRGGAGNDYLFGLGGNDFLQGDAGSDYMEGGTGADNFVYFQMLDSPAGEGFRDFIRQFEVGLDRIDLGLIDPSDAPGNQPLVFIGSSAFSGSPGQVRSSPTGEPNTHLVEVDINGDLLADMEIMVVTTTNAPLTANEFFLGF